MEEKIFTVSEISKEIKRIVEQYIPEVWVEGEVSNYSQSRAGHIYFSLKDPFALIDCVIWRNIASSVPFQISNGMRLIIRGEVTTYMVQSQYQINVHVIRPAGFGSLYVAFEALKEKLNRAGYFDPERRRPIPKYPKRIGIVTSPTGAAIQDMLQISHRRNSSVEIVVYPALVQGEGAADSLIEGIRILNTLGGFDFIIIGRGGGSIEDLWAFNEEKLIHAIVESKIPIVSAVGHEVDYTLSDFVADMRAPTPSAAIELTIPESSEIRNSIMQMSWMMQQLLLRRLNLNWENLHHIQKRLYSNRPVGIIRQRIQMTDHLEMRLILAIRKILQMHYSNLDGLIQTLQAMNPKTILKRGFSIVYHLPDKKIIKTLEAVQPQDYLLIEVSDGLFDAEAGIHKTLK